MTKSFFTISEMTQSETAERYNIDNTPNEEQLGNLRELISELLNPLREEWGEYCNSMGYSDHRIEVTSGLRSAALNKKIGGSNTSAHSYGLAADLVPYNKDLKGFRKFVSAYLKDKVFDQCIFEEIDKNGAPKWIHVGWKNGLGKQRKQFLEYKNGVYINVNV